MYKLNHKNSAFKGSVELEVDGKTRKPLLTTDHEINFNSDAKEVLRFTMTKYPARTRLSEKPTNKMNIDKIHSLKIHSIKYDEGSIINGRRESMFSFSLGASPVFKFFKEPTSFLFTKVEKAMIVDITNILSREQ